MIERNFMFTVGSDPEFMLVDGNNLKSAIEKIKRNAEDRIKIKGHEFYYDNVLGECAVKPASGKEKVIASFKECLEIYAELVSPLKLTARAYAEYPESELNHPDARRVGCAIDRCAYLVADVKPPKSIIEGTALRSGGGHIHLGSKTLLNEYGLFLAPTIVLMDLFLGIPSLYIDHDPTSAKRRSIYGQAGRYRIKEYGLEYRTLSNFWLASPKLVGFMYDLSEFVLGLTAEIKKTGEDIFESDLCHCNFDKYCGDKPAKAYKYAFDVNELQKTINSSDKENKMLDFVLSKLPQNLVTEFEQLRKPVQYDLYKEWDL